MKKIVIAAVALAALNSSANAGYTADFKRPFDTVLCKGDSEVEWESPDPGLSKPQNKSVTVLITSTPDGWTTSGEFGFPIKRWKRNSKGGFPVGSASWDEEGIWAHWTVGFLNEGQVVFEKHSRQGVEVAVLKCEYALGGTR
ncbi:hypothetical protein ACRQ5Q_40685 [Bradyrhizobium sp. PMVTL-01]|uniref:hypothetical protein n=1 Tax=Bradyrhizobium sp. PMVTL-01 TaxID=3434999 RepID=UPI003F701CE8